jgi:hypothetical protein
VSDELLSIVYRRFFVLSKTIRRYGSSVPGPMEGRKRLGRRRMTHLSEAVPTSAWYPGSTGGLFGDTTKTQWQWEAPSRRLSRPEVGKVSLPGWLSAWDPTSPEDATARLRTDNTESTEESLPIEEDVRQFHEGARNTSDLDLYLAKFNQKLTQSLTLGVVSNDMLGFILSRITEDIGKLSDDPKLISRRCIAFYTSFWDGVSACKVFGPVDIDGRVLNEFLILISYLKSTDAVQTLANKIIRSSSIAQLQCMELGSMLLVRAWSLSWLETSRSVRCESGFRAVEALLVESRGKLLSAHKLSMNLEIRSASKELIVMARDSLANVYVAISQAMASIATLESIMFPLRASAQLLADTLGSTPRESILKMMSSWEEDLRTICNLRPNESSKLRYHWLITIAHLSIIDSRTFFQMWQRLEKDGKVSENQASHILLIHWTSQGKVAESARVRNSFEASASRYGEENFASLLFALEKHREKSLTRTRELFHLLEGLGRYKTVYKILSQMNGLGLKVPVGFLGQAVENLSKYDSSLALRAFHLHKTIILGDRRFRLDWVPKFVLSLVHNRSVKPEEIWHLLGIPIYTSLPSFKRRFQRTILPQTQIELLHQMALEFANSKARPTRVAIRNILQCLYHLRVHRAPIAADFSRAMSRAGISQEILNGQWIRQERLQYILNLIENLEGKTIADQVNATVASWRQNLSTKQAEQRREGNALRIGPID